MSFLLLRNISRRTLRSNNFKFLATAPIEKRNKTISNYKKVAPTDGYLELSETLNPKVPLDFNPIDFEEKPICSLYHSPNMKSYGPLEDKIAKIFSSSTIISKTTLQYLILFNHFCNYSLEKIKIENRIPTVKEWSISYIDEYNLTYGYNLSSSSIERSLAKILNENPKFRFYKGKTISSSPSHVSPLLEQAKHEASFFLRFYMTGHYFKPSEEFPQYNYLLKHSEVMPRIPRLIAKFFIILGGKDFNRKTNYYTSDDLERISLTLYFQTGIYLAKSDLNRLLSLFRGIPEEMIEKFYDTNVLEKIEKNDESRMSIVKKLDKISASQYILNKNSSTMQYFKRGRIRSTPHMKYLTIDPNLLSFPPHLLPHFPLLRSCFDKDRENFHEIEYNNYIKNSIEFDFLSSKDFKLNDLTVSEDIFDVTESDFYFSNDYPIIDNLKVILSNVQPDYSLHDKLFYEAYCLLKFGKYKIKINKTAISDPFQVFLEDLSKSNWFEWTLYGIRDLIALHYSARVTHLNIPGEKYELINEIFKKKYLMNSSSFSVMRSMEKVKHGIETPLKSYLIEKKVLIPSFVVTNIFNNLLNLTNSDYLKENIDNKNEEFWLEQLNTYKKHFPSYYNYKDIQTLIRSYIIRDNSLDINKINKNFFKFVPKSSKKNYFINKNSKLNTTVDEDIEDFLNL